MGKGHEYLRRLHDVLEEFENAIVRREHKKLLESEIPLKQAVDHARQRVVEEIVKIVTEERSAPANEEM